MTNQRSQRPRRFNRLLVMAILLATTGCAGSQATGVVTAIPNEVANQIPHTVEEDRVDEALLALGEAASMVTRELAFAPLATEMVHRSVRKVELARLLDKAQQAGETLWRDAARSARQAVSKPPQAVSKPPQALDDRPLYWRRLLEKREFRKHCAAANLCEQVLHVFERASRGATDLRFRAAADLRILISGFDPFGLDNHVNQSNPSGVAALTLDDRLLSANGKTAEVQSVLFPVRFADFDEGMVEEIFEPFVNDPANGQAPDLLITISMGRSDFDLERFPGRRRSATAPDNLRVKTGASATTPLVPLLHGRPLNGPEFVEFSLPAAQMRSVQAPYRVNDNRGVATLENGRFAAQSLAQLAGQTSVSGSGGGYLSNEISYRTVRLVQLHDRDIAVGHIHTPRIEAFDQAAINAITNQIHAMLRDLVATLP